MPVYAFRCPRCEHEFEVSRRFSEFSETAECPIDGAESARIFTPPTLLLERRAGGSAPSAGSDPSSVFPTHGHSHGPGGVHTH